GLGGGGSVAVAAAEDRLTALMGAAAAGSAEHYGPADAAKMPPDVKAAVFDSLAHGYGVAFLVTAFVLLGAFLLAVTVIRVSAEDVADAEPGVVI
ncbi:hypothetical protein, partial [Streptomyces sp. NPDC058953]|uniref:hypothetical protein n=1 Tax=Streptomyces sp. NPDC058953 TaxID=3346676 RepID=UPI00367AC4AA